MKNLIAVFTYCPDDRRKKILYNFLSKIQSLRKDYKILLLSHSQIPDLVFDMVDFFYFDSENPLLTDFDKTNKFWFRDGTLCINSSLAYPNSTHLAIYRLIYYAVNFSKFMGFTKLHMIEYDLKVDDLMLINEVNDYLNDYDNIMFRDSNGWIWGVYFATKLTNWDVKESMYDEKKIIDDLMGVENRMTESVTPKFLSGQNRSIKYLDITMIDKNEICSYVDEHQNYELKWCVPIIENETDNLCFFIFNETGGEYIVDVFVDNHCTSFGTRHKNNWSLIPIGKFSEVNEIVIFVNKKLKNKIVFTEENRKHFIKDNFLKYN